MTFSLLAAQQVGLFSEERGNKHLWCGRHCFEPRLVVGGETDQITVELFGSHRYAGRPPGWGCMFRTWHEQTSSLAWCGWRPTHFETKPPQPSHPNTPRARVDFVSHFVPLSLSLSLSLCGGSAPERTPGRLALLPTEVEIPKWRYRREFQWVGFGSNMILRRFRAQQEVFRRCSWRFRRGFDGTLSFSGQLIRLMHAKAKASLVVCRAKPGGRFLRRTQCC